MPVIEIVKNPEKVLKKLTLEKMAKDKREHIIFMSPEMFYKIFSPERIKLLMFLSKGKAESISDLARKLGRKFEAVHRDLRYLKGFGLVKLKEEDTGRVPYVGESIEVKMVSI